MKGYYFSTNDRQLLYGDKRVIKTGVTHKVKGKPVLCQFGLHASSTPIDALRYSPGPILWRVELGGYIVQGHDKSVATERHYIGGFDASDLLRQFARDCALMNIEKIKSYCDHNHYETITKWLMTGNPEYRSAARSAAWSAAESAARSAARSAAAAAWSAAESAAAAAESAARSAARSAAWSAARSDLNQHLETLIFNKRPEWRDAS